MNRFLRLVLIVVLPMIGGPAPTCRAEQAAEERPAFGWQFATPESQGMSTAALEALKQELARRKTRALLVIRNDRIVCEWYAEGYGPTKPQGTASLAKALVGGLSLGIALTDSRIALDDAVSRYVPRWKDDPRKAKITIRHLGTHTSGLSDSTTPGVKHEDQPSWMGTFWKRLDPPDDPFTIADDTTPILFEPGSVLQYSNPGIGMLTYCVTAAVADSPIKDVRTLLRDRVMRPIGVADTEWSCGYGKTFTVDGLPLVAAWGGGSYTPRAAARIGRMLLHEGDWDGRRLLTRDAVRQITGDAGLPGHCGMGFWTNAAGRYPYLPKDAYWGAGAGDQVLLVVPSLNLIVVRNGETLATPDELKQAKPRDVLEEFHDPRARILFLPLINAISDRALSSATRTLLDAARLPLFDRALNALYVESPERLVAHVGSSGAAGENLKWEEKKADHWFIEQQRWAAEFVQAGVVRGDPATLSRGLKMLEWGFNRQGPEGDFPGTGDAFHSTTYFLEAAARALLVLQQSGDQAHAGTLARDTPKVVAAARWLTRPEVAARGRKGNTPYTHRRYALAAALGAAAVLAGGDPDLSAAADTCAREGLALQTTEGINPEKGGGDVNYQAAGILFACRYLTVCPDPELRARLQQMIDRGLRWEESRVDDQGRVSTEGSTRVAKERARGGTVKEIAYKIIFQAFVFGSALTGETKHRGVAERVAKDRKWIQDKPPPAKP